MHLSLLRLVPFLLCAPVVAGTAVAGCFGDRDKDHRPRVNCTAAGLRRVPGIEPSTKVLLFPQNQFSDLSWTSFAVFTEIYEIDLTENQLSTLSPGNAPNLPSLQVLRLGSNRLRAVPDRWFSGASALTELYLPNNLISALGHDSFSGLSKLEILDLSNNHVQDLPGRLMHPLTAVETLYLEGNKIKVLPDDWFSQKEEVPYLYLSANPWACSCSLGYLHRYLEEYEGNVYVRDGPIITVDVESVLCDSPRSLKGKSVIHLKESDFCDDEAGSPEPTALANSPTPAVTHTVAPDVTQSYAEVVTTYKTYTVVSWYEVTRAGEFLDLWESLRGDGRKVKGTTIPSTTELPTTTFTTFATSTQQSSTVSPTFSTSNPTEVQPTAYFTLEPVTMRPTDAVDDASCAIRDDGRSNKASYVETRGVFCFWLFVSCIFLCVISAASSLITAFRLYFWYRGVYKSLKCIIVGKEQVRMVTYCRNVDKQQARYRTMLFVSKDMSKSNQVECFVNLELNVWAEEAKNVEKVVYKQAMYRVLSREEEIEAEDVLAECTASREANEDTSKKRYSVILREVNEKDGGETEKCDWVVGGWEVEKGAGPGSSWGEWLGQILPSMPWRVNAPPKREAESEACRGNERGEE